MQGASVLTQVSQVVNMGVDQGSVKSLPLTEHTYARPQRIKANIDYKPPIRLNTRESDCQSYTCEESIKYGIQEDGVKPKTRSERKRVTR